jgi:hypothetical protein
VLFRGIWTLLHLQRNCSLSLCYAFPYLHIRDINIHLVFSEFTSRATALLASNKASVFLFMVFIFSPAMLTSSAQAKTWCVLFSFSPTWFSWTPLMAYSKAQLKSYGHKASPCFRPFWTGNLSDWYLPIRTVLWVSFKHIWISPATFMGISNSMRIFYSTSLLTESYVFLKSINSWCTVPLYSHLFPSVCRI